MLTGSALLEKVKAIGQAPREDIAIACGYVNKGGKPAFTAFYEALNAAHGISFAPPTTKARRGKSLSWNVAVAKSGIIPVSAGYSALLGLAPGDRVDIRHDGTTLVLTAAPVAASSPEKAAETIAACPTPVEPVAAATRELAAV